MFISVHFVRLVADIELCFSSPPSYMLDIGKQTNQFFDSFADPYGHKKYKLKSLEQYSREHNTQEQPGKQYFKATSLPEIIQQAPMPTFKSTSRQAHEAEKGSYLSLETPFSIPMTYTRF